MQVAIDKAKQSGMAITAVRNWDLDSDGLQNLLVASPSTPGQAPRGEMLVNGPGTLIVGGGKPPVVISGRVLPPLRRRAGLN